MKSNIHVSLSSYLGRFAKKVANLYYIYFN